MLIYRVLVDALDSHISMRLVGSAEVEPVTAFRLVMRGVGVEKKILEIETVRNLWMFEHDAQFQEFSDKFVASTISGQTIEIYIDGRGSSKTAQSELIMELLKSRLRLRALRQHMGYVENGTAESVILFQDDATGDYFIRTKDKDRKPSDTMFDKSFEGLLDKLIAYTDDNPT